MVMPREVLVAWVGRHRRDAWEAMCAHYRERIGRWVRIEDRPIRVRIAGEGAVRLEAEAEAVRAALPDPCWRLALRRRARPLTSEALARRLAKLFAEWPHPVAFVIGSDLGLAASLASEAQESLSLGPLTLPHELARLVLYEQLYRALSINAGIKYHRVEL